MPALSGRGPFSYDTITLSGTNVYTLVNATYDPTNGETLEVLVAGTKIQGVGLSTAGTIISGDGFYVNSLTNPTTISLTPSASTGYVPVSVVIPAGATYGFICAITVGTVQYTNGTGTPGVTPWASDANVTLTEGHGGTYPTGLNFNPRNWNGTVHYGDPSASAYTFAWSNGDTTEDISGLSAGVYIITATDCNGCSATATYTVIGLGIPGCIDSTALNYNSLATVDDGSCIYCVYGCMDSTQFNYNPLATCDDGSCIPFIYGCTDPLALNYYPGANVDDGSCVYPTTCNNPTPTGIFASDIIHDRARINWNDMNTSWCLVEQVRIQYREVGTTAWGYRNAVGSGLCVFGLPTTSKVVFNLSAATTYEYQIKSWYCNTSGASTWSAVNTFTTSAACPNISGLAVTTPLTTKAVFTWNSTGTYSFVRIKYRVNTTGSTWYLAGGFGVMYPALTKNKNGLTPGESYLASTRTWCDPSGGPFKSSGWTPFIYWTQPTVRLEGENTSISNLQVYPNPSKDIFNITFISEEIQNLRVRILNVIGEEVYKEDLEQFVGEYVKAINLEKYNKAIYFLEIETDDGVINKKLILQ